MKKVVVVLVALAAAAGASAVVDRVLQSDSAEERVEQYLTGEGEREFVSAEAGFRATFPRVPERSSEETDAGGQPIVVKLFSAELEDAAFTVAVFDLASGAPFDLDGGVNGAAAAVDGRVENATRVKVQGFDAVEFLVAAPDGVFVKQLMVRAPARVYQLGVVGKQNPPSGYDKFKSSFQITT